MALTLVAGLLSTGLATAMVVNASPANAAYATGGTGLYKDTIDWLTWEHNPSNLQTLSNGATLSSERTIGGQVLRTECTLNVEVGAFRTYKPGTWLGDSFDDMYNIGGTGTANQLMGGIMSNSGMYSEAQGTYICSATLNGEPVEIAGMVVSDAEETEHRGANLEYVKLTSLDPNASFRLIEQRAPICPNNNGFRLTRNGPEVLFDVPNVACGVSWGISGNNYVAYLEGQTEFRFNMRSAAAIAVGVVLNLDTGDAPDSYGQPWSLFTQSWQGPEIPEGQSWAKNLPLSVPSDAGPTRLGTSITADTAPLHSADASADEGDDSADFSSGINVKRGTTFSTDVACTGPGFVSGWIDWNNNGVFDDGEKSDVQECTGSSVSLEWTVPDGAVSATTFARLRIDTQASALTPTGFGTGEIEDYQVVLNIAEPSLAVEKTSNATENVRIGDEVTYTITATNTGGDDFTATNPAMIVDDLSGVLDDADLDEATILVATSDTSAVIGPAVFDAATKRIAWEGPLAAGETVTLTYTVTVKDGGDRTAKNIAFVGDPTDPGMPTPDPETCVPGTTTGDVSCTEFLLPNLTVTKVADKTVDVAPGDVVTYTVTATNSGPGAFTVDAPATITDDLSDVIDDGTYQDDASVTPAGGALDYVDPLLTWSGPLASGEDVVIEYTVVMGVGVDGNVRNVAFVGDGDTPVCTEDEQTSQTCAEVEFPVIQPGLIWQKVDGSDTKLSGSEWRLVPLDEHGAELDAQAIVIIDCDANDATDCDAANGDLNPEKGELLVKPLMPGDYKLYETKAPAGFMLLTAPIGVTIDATALDVNANFDLGAIVNDQQAVPAIPLTGGMGELGFLLAGGGAALIAATLILLRLRKKHNDLSLAS
ncbi:hypothetical protein GCM10009693_15560 [Leucobacter chromiireducens subsp. chromiireducens]